eukprot:CAMPEP_0113908224 /NCGR_PEP_ID=MMETSP0780_2-20120614/26019_1 /TAXON_ID=652834 /ORGANISM="Palpitomonas bilix" /LENGTH=116 /DNA_ID=CAMNT_0000903581 /DNA_START=45 /DNA_END=392 /DNA_ORIENTATION=+ /assembly_acc=CAM_ASM_000599
MEKNGEDKREGAKREEEGEEEVGEREREREREEVENVGGKEAVRQLEEWMEEKLKLTLKNGRVIEGTFRAFDHFGNLLLANAEEILGPDLAQPGFEKLNLTVISINLSLLDSVVVM